MKSEKEIKFERIYQKYRKMVDSICKYYMLPRRNDKVQDDIYADLAQDVWLRMWERIDELDESSNLKYYIQKYTMNTSILYYNYNPNKIFSAFHRVPLSYIENMPDNEIISQNLYNEQSEQEYVDLYYKKFINPYLTHLQEIILKYIQEGYKHCEIEKELRMNSYYYRLELQKLKDVIKAKGYALYELEDEFQL